MLGIWPLRGESLSLTSHESNPDPSDKNMHLPNILAISNVRQRPLWLQEFLWTVLAENFSFWIDIRAFFTTFVNGCGKITLFINFLFACVSDVKANGNGVHSKHSKSSAHQTEDTLFFYAVIVLLLMLLSGGIYAYFFITDADILGNYEFSTTWLCSLVTGIWSVEVCC